MAENGNEIAQILHMLEKIPKNKTVLTWRTCPSSQAHWIASHYLEKRKGKPRLETRSWPIESLSDSLPPVMAGQTQEAWLIGSLAIT